MMGEGGEGGERRSEGGVGGGELGKGGRHDQVTKVWVWPSSY